VAELRSTMGNDEYVGWSVYYQLRAQDQELAEKVARTR